MSDVNSWSIELQKRLIAAGQDQDESTRNIMAEAACLLAKLTIHTEVGSAHKGKPAVYLINALPNYCPSCGKVHSEEWKDANADDFMIGASGVCECGTRYQYLEKSKILEASKLNEFGDLTRYADK